MLNNRFIGIFVLTVAFVSLTMLVGNFAYAGEKQPEGTGPSEALILPTCPTCKNASAGHTEGKAIAASVMVCPECKKELSELRVYHCDECKKEFLACPMCQGTSKVVTKAQIVKRFLQHKSR
ncbi:superfamily II helicase [Candidatus Scalindua japonica]|uniref:Superfamily II helicase n=1 Tax=Candidatus Scalindua japonica TaxID=1284222 RepID=A0A286TT75_9BACT|nr:hypothetical protein [Candidatus Scalindua japonica]GAX59087.1 superfamily II helicase [Candidatus Scalindua japonica]